MEILEKEICSFLRISHERNHLMETEEEEKVPRYKAGIHACPERPIAEKSLCLEAEEEEESTFSEIPF